MNKCATFFFNGRVYAKQKINLTWPHIEVFLEIPHDAA